MYGVRGRTWIAMGDPIGPAETRAELAWKFRELCDQYDGLPVFYQVDPDQLATYVDLGLSMLKLGDEARVNLKTFTLDGPSMRDLRYGHRRSLKEGAVFEVLSPLQVPAILPELRAISDHWLDAHKTREKGFSVGHFDETYLSGAPCAVVRKDGRIVAFTNLWLGAGLQELSVDLMRYVPHQIYGVMDFMFVELLLWGQKQGYQWFNLGMAPLSGLEARKLSPVWYRIGALAYRFGDQFYNFQGLRKYKEKFNPEWRPKFLASPGGMALGRVLLDVTALISGGITGTVRK
jgi:phosphatidylglycerol lysyltransferase